MRVASQSDYLFETNAITLIIFFEGDDGVSTGLLECSLATSTMNAFS